jgi:pimeloyl-ACP methyl ester carboxylesterase
MIINIHGFTGSGDNTKYRWLKAHVPHHEIHSPTFDYAAVSPESILQQLADKVSAHMEAQPPGAAPLHALGSSLGGFFARCLNLLFPQITTVLINPSLVPFLTLRGYIDCKAYLALFARLAYRDDTLAGEQSRLRVIIGDSDELINHELLTKPLLPPDFRRLYIIGGGRHQLELTPEVGGILKSILE